MLITKAEAMDQVYSQYAKGLDSAHPTTDHVTKLNSAVESLGPAEKMKDRFSFDVKHPSFIREEQGTTNTEKADCLCRPPLPDLQSAMIEMMKLQCAPKPDIDAFSGDPLDYFYFRESFKDVVETAVSDQRGRLTRLIKYTTGDAKDLIKHLVHADPKNCYDIAISFLDKEYGNPYRISCLYIKELRQWDPVKQYDTVAFKKFYRFLLKCETYRIEGNLQELNSTDMIKTIISKIHTTYQERWNRRASDTRLRQHREADFSDLVKFVEAEMILMCDLAYSRDALRDLANVKNYATRFTEEKHTASTGCPLCVGEHDLEDCKDYLEKDIDQRHRAIFRLRLCFSCLRPVTDDHFGEIVSFPK